MNQGKYICVDFDGTCVAHEFPNIGKDVGAVPVLKKLAAAGHKLILWTMRDGDKLQEAIDWFVQNGIELYASQANPSQKRWTSSPKAYAHMYIDDAAMGCPVIVDETVSGRPFADWPAIESILTEKGLI